MQSTDKPPVYVKARRLRRDDALAAGGTLTSEPTWHPSGYVAAEVGYEHLRCWRPDEFVAIRQREER